MTCPNYCRILILLIFLFIGNLNGLLCCDGTLKERECGSSQCKHINAREIGTITPTWPSEKFKDEIQAAEKIDLHHFLFSRPEGLLLLSVMLRGSLESKNVLFVRLNEKEVRADYIEKKREIDYSSEDGNMVEIYKQSFWAQLRDHQLAERIYVFQDISSGLHHAFVSFTEEDMVVTDVDDTLIWFLDPYNTVHALKNTPLHKNFSSLEDNVRERFFHWCDLTAPCNLIDPQSPQLISALQKRRIKVTPLTAMRPLVHETLEMEKDRPKWRVRHLKELGFDFSKAFSLSTLGWLLDTEGNNCFPEPCFEEGIIFSGLAKKDLTLLSFFKIMGFQPRMVLYIDDSLENVFSVYKELTRVGIKCYAILYTGAKKIRIHPRDSTSLTSEFNQYLKKQEEFIAELLVNPSPLPDELHL